MRARGIAVRRLMGSHRFVAWLAVVALALVVVMPAVSRVMPMTGSMPGMDGACPGHLARGATPSPPPHLPAHPTDRCGYCLLLHHSPLLGSGAIAYLIPEPPRRTAIEVALPAGKPGASSLSADPRGPPAAV